MKKIGLILIVFLFSVSLFSSDKDFEKKYNLKSKEDKKNGIIWYQHKKALSGNNRISLYIGKRVADNISFLRLSLVYYGSENLFVKEYVFTVDDEEHVLTPRKTIETVELRQNPISMDSESNVSRGIAEVYDVAVNQEEYDLMKKISNAKTVKLRYNGTKGFKRIKIHNTPKKAIKDVLNAYRELTSIS